MTFTKTQRRNSVFHYIFVTVGANIIGYLQFDSSYVDSRVQDREVVQRNIL
jgi:hypothetical protein